MAKKLNQSRMRDSKLLLIATFVIAVFSREYWSDETLVHEIFDFCGYVFLAVCALGRLYTTAFLGGHKNAELIDYGPFSVVRNPLYFFSIIGIFGIALVSNQPILMIGLPLTYVAIYLPLIKREEGHLKEIFGEPYESYKKHVPSLIPNFKLYHAPDRIMMAPRSMNNAFADAIWWFFPFPFLELLEYLHSSGVIHTFN